MNEQSHDDDHDLGLEVDLRVMAARMRERRRVVGWLLAGGATAVAVSCGGGGGSTGSNVASTGTGSGTGSGSSSSTCLADPEETAGPYPGDGSNTVNGMVSNVLSESGVVRSDIRSSFGTSSTVAPGVPLALTLSLTNTNDSCGSLSGYAVYLWHCNRDGAYSLYGSGIQDENYLRGVQVSDSNGEVTFQTIFPACYSGRYPHIHFEIYPSLALATGYTNKILTSQMAMPLDVCNTVFAGAEGYGQSVSNLSSVSISTDMVFGDNTAAQIALQTPALMGSVDAGYTGTIVIGVPA